MWLSALFMLSCGSAALGQNVYEGNVRRSKLLLASFIIFH